MSNYFRKTKTNHLKTQTEISNSYAGTALLLNLELGLANYNTSIIKLFSDGLNYESGPVLDFGAGNGTLAEIWREKFGITPFCSEIDPNLRFELEKKGFKTIKDMKLERRKFSYIYTSNVLEHIENDLAALKELNRVLAKGGRLAIYVPAMPYLFSELDFNVGHFRRYTKKYLSHILKESDFRIISIKYADSLGFFAALLIKILGFGPDKMLGSFSSLSFYDEKIFPISKFFDNIGVSNFFGKNLIVIAEKI